jgi:hypothetical protein
MSRRSLWTMVALIIAMTGQSSSAGLVFISPTGSSGPGGTITFSEIGPFDNTYANVNSDFTAIGTIPVLFMVSDSSPVSIYGSDVNDTLSTWIGFTATIGVGSATFLDPNDPYGSFSTYSDTPGWSVTLANGGTEAIFSGGSIAPGDSLDTFLGLAVSDPSAPVTLVLQPLVSVPTPPSLALTAIAGAIVGIGRLARRARFGRSITLLLAVLVLSPGLARAGEPQVVAAYQGNFTLAAVGTVPGLPTQMALGPDGLLYVMTTDAGPIRFNYDQATGTLTSLGAAAPQVQGIGIGFQGSNMYLTSFDGTIHKLTDNNGDGIWGGACELDVAIVTGLPQGDHNTDQIQISGKTLYVGIGRRTINGHFGAWTSGTLDDLGGQGFFDGGTGRTYGDSAYNGTIAWIQDLNAVVDQTASANAWTTQPPLFSQALIQKDSGPFTTQGAGKLLVHSAGTRNPYGLCLDSNGDLWFTNNFNRTATLGNGQAGFGLRGDQLDSNFSHDVQDQLFHASPGADYGYTDINWRGVNPMMTPSAPRYNRVKSSTFDNSFNKGPYTIHDPANPDGLGPSASADGCSFFYAQSLPVELQGNIFIVRYNGTITEAPGGLGRSLTYSDLVAVDVSTGKVRQIATGFNGPLVVFADNDSERLLIANYGDSIVYALQVVQP